MNIVSKTGNMLKGQSTLVGIPKGFWLLLVAVTLSGQYEQMQRSIANMKIVIPAILEMFLFCYT